MVKQICSEAGIEKKEISERLTTNKWVLSTIILTRAPDN
jgi:hypothetical protein